MRRVQRSSAEQPTFADGECVPASAGVGPADEAIAADVVEPTIPRRRPLTVIYLAGHGRCGSTIVGKVLGELDRAAYVGELNFFWSDGVLGGRPCGCGLPLVKCPPWSGVLDELGPRRLDLARLATDLLRQTTRLRHGVQALTAVGARRLDSAVTELAGYLEDLYQSIAEAFGVDILIDSSKSPMYARILRSVPSLNVETIHLVRDPRAAAHSWSQPKSEPVGGATLPTFSAMHSALEWTAVNLLTLHASRSSQGTNALVRYEDVMGDPVREFGKLGRLLGRDFSALEISDDGTIALGTTHSVAGNPGRFSTGSIRLVPDERWITESTRGERILVPALTLPVLLRLGYPVMARSPRTADDDRRWPRQRP